MEQPCCHSIITPFHGWKSEASPFEVMFFQSFLSLNSLILHSVQLLPAMVEFSQGDALWIWMCVTRNNYLWRDSFWARQEEQKTDLLSTMAENSHYWNNEHNVHIAGFFLRVETITQSIFIRGRLEGKIPIITGFSFVLLATTQETWSCKPFSATPHTSKIIQ